MSDWTFKELEEWDQRICSIARSEGLDWYPILYEVCDYYEMIGHMSYHGMPAHYHHWSFGKSFERTHHMYNVGATGLPYELIINTDPSIAYLMRENPMYLQILIMAHCVGHSDFFKNNATFAGTDPSNIISKMRYGKKKIQEYIEDPSIGITKVEKILDAAHSIGMNVEHYGRKRIPHEILKNGVVHDLKNDVNNRMKNVDVNKVPIRNDYDLLGFMIEHGKHFEDWQRDILEIVHEESLYFVPQIRTKVLNEGWASFWHYRIMNELDLPQSFHIPFLKSHNQVVSPHPHSINPYFVGFKLFKMIEREMGIKECFNVREIFHDQSAIRHFLTRELCEELGLFTFSMKSSRGKRIHSIDDVHDDEGWKEIRDALAQNVGVGSMPKIYVDDMDRWGNLTLVHEHDGRDIDEEFAKNVIGHVTEIWPGGIKLVAQINGAEQELEF